MRIKTEIDGEGLDKQWVSAGSPPFAMAMHAQHSKAEAAGQRQRATAETARRIPRVHR